VPVSRLSSIAVFLLFGTASSAAEKPRVFITESRAPNLSGTSTGGVKGTLAFVGGTSSYNLKVIQTFSQSCPGAVVTSDREKAQFVMRLDHEDINPTSVFVPPNRVAVFNRNKDLIYSGTTRRLGSAVKGACAAIVNSGE
jgi:hypothetical protein